MDSRDELLNGVQQMKNPKLVVVDDEMKAFNYENGYDNDGNKLDCFIVDLETVSNGVHDGHTSPSNKITSNSRITLQRSLCRKVPQQRDIFEWKCNDNIALLPSSSPKAKATSIQEKTPHPTTSHTVSQDNSIHNQLSQYHITIKTDDSSTVPEHTWGRRSSFKRSPPSWFNDPKRILFLFATLSSLGTMLLIFLTLFMCKRIEKVGSVLDWQ